MKLMHIISQSGHDFLGYFKCEHCDHTPILSGFDDLYFHNEVIPMMKCERCGKVSPESYNPLPPTYLEVRREPKLNKEKKMSDLTVKELIAMHEQIESHNRGMWKIGECYFIRTVTMHSVGRLIAITDDELLLEDASWVADSGRFNNALKTGELDEVEPFVHNVIVNRKAVIDATVWSHELPREVK